MMDARTVADFFNVPPWLLDSDEPRHRWTWKIRRRYRLWRRGFNSDGHPKS